VEAAEAEVDAEGDVVDVVEGAQVHPGHVLIQLEGVGRC